MKTFPNVTRGAFGLALTALFVADDRRPAGAVPSGFGAVTGRVLDYRSLQPIAGASIAVGNIVAVTAVADQGAFLIRALPAGTYALLISANGWQAYRTKIVVKPNETTDIGNIGLPRLLNP